MYFLAPKNKKELLKCVLVIKCVVFYENERIWCKNDTKLHKSDAVLGGKCTKVVQIW